MKIAFLGDSITEGVGASSYEKCYVKQVERKLQCETLNYGISGTRIARQSKVNKDFPCMFDWDFQQRAQIMSADVEKVFVFGGTNDFGHGDAVIGEINSRDSYTFCGGLRNLLEILLNKYDKEKICFILPLRRLYEEENGKKLSDYIEILVRILTEYEIEYLDFYKEGLPKPISEEDVAYFIDGLHPNDLGHAIIADKICAYLGKKTCTKIKYFFDEKDDKFSRNFTDVQLLDNEVNSFDLATSDKIVTNVIHMPTEDYLFLHEPAVIEFKGTLFASWYNCPREEQVGRSPIRGRRSKDGGRTWTDVEIIVDDEKENIFYCPPVYGVCDDKLYLLVNEMLGADLMHAIDLFVFNEENNKFELVWSKPIPFKLNTNVYQLSNGKLMLPGRVAEMDGFPNTPAVLISDSGKIDAEWRLVKIAPNGDLPDSEGYIHPELSAIVEDKTIIMFVRNDRNRVPLLYISKDNGEHWSHPIVHDIPFAASKTYSGVLSNGRKYVIGNIAPDRGNLAIFLTDQGKDVFNRAFLIQKKVPWGEFCGRQWSYPVAHEADGKLYVIYSAETNDPSVRGALLSVIPIDI